jgi:flavin reductase (DIM6/NTAB) family NADH-FMN oxidoreductase RutF
MVVRGAEWNIDRGKVIDYACMDNAAQTPEPVTNPGLDAFKHAFRRHAAGVAAVTSRAPDGSPVGFTATSLASLAAVPPLATFNMAQISSAWPAMTVGNRLAIHMLGPRTLHHAQRMAADRDVRFAGEHWHLGPHDVPLLEGVTAWMSGRIIEVHPVHDNAVIVVQIEDGELGPEDEPLLYHERRYLKPGDLA